MQPASSLPLGTIDVIQLLPCSKCEQTFVLQPDVSEQATIACPSCEQEFVLKELLESQYGYWKVVSDPDAELKLASEKPDFKAVSRPPSATTAAVAASTANALADDGEELRISAAEERPKHKQKFTHVEPITYEQFERMKRKDRSPLWSAIQILLGGLAAIPIALILIWHLLGKDIGGAGPVVAEYAPWLVPEKFHPEKEGDDPETSEWEEEEDDGFPEEKGTPGGFRQFSEEELSGTPGEEDWESAGYSGSEGSGTSNYEGYPGEEPTESEGSGTRGGGIPGKERDVNLGSAVDTGGGTPSGDDTTDTPGGEKEPSGEPESGDSSSTSDSESATSTSDGIAGMSRKDMIAAAMAKKNKAAEDSSKETNASEPTKQKAEPKNSKSDSEVETPANSTGAKVNVYGKIENCLASLEEWRNGGDTDIDSKQKLGESIFQQLAGLTDELAKLPAGSPFFKAVRDKMQPIGKAVKQREELQEVVQQLASENGAKLTTGTISLALSIDIESVEEEAKFWRVTPNNEGLDFEIEAIQVPKTLAPALIEGQRLLVLGKLKGEEQVVEMTAFYIHSL